MKSKTLKIIKNDPWLEPYRQAIEGRYNYALSREKSLTKGGSLSEFANGHLFFGLHKHPDGWTFREWAPNADSIYLIGEFNQWERRPEYALEKKEHGVWEIHLAADCLKHGDLYKMYVSWPGGSGERIPAWTRRVVQDPVSLIFSAQVWEPANPYRFKHKVKPPSQPLFIYECHIGMATEEERIGTYDEFRRLVLPRIVDNGYNAIQIMAIQEHPYYGSFGYHVSSFFAASSRFGTPEELKRLIDEAHGYGLAVIMDIVHSHAVKNSVEGLGCLDGDPNLYFHSGDRREHPAWDSLCFNYGRDEVLHFLLSNCKYWLDEFRFDGFRFDGVTSMLYRSHGLGESFSSYDDYYNLNQDGDAIAYLTLANKLIHEIKPKAITIAEEVSGMPGLAAPIKDGGIGFDYRMAMGIPDFWIKLIKEYSDEDWKPGAIWWELTNRRKDEKTISYAESHDQALVGDKTIIFRLIDADMYWHMSKNDQNLVVDRGIALHKIIRLLTASTINGGYLNFMGNEFGHPEWIDFPREGNGWSYKYARRQWSLLENRQLKYADLHAFDKAMVLLLKKINPKEPLYQRWLHDQDQIMAFERASFLFVFNLHPSRSFVDYGILVQKGNYKIVLNSDAKEFGGFGLVDEQVVHTTTQTAKNPDFELEWIRLYLPSRTALVLKRQ
ncbi:MAG TPA: alpha amylase C-terminal domain-containing protein [Bacteroidales bacterium]|nr:alpha amylase C-terminal domain-containing protein [Bacteroidales bacterium]HOQ58621.1 alpha amylase C-terminal domain-containing protein [Bacteroidales bacterium]HPL06293.1 alpha amylase C-terminal domain-containing protein [Bacteroidales bacterium]